MGGSAWSMAAAIARMAFSLGWYGVGPYAKGLAGKLQPKAQGSTEQASCPRVTSEARTSSAPQSRATPAVISASFAATYRPRCNRSSLSGRRSGQEPASGSTVM